MKWHAFEPADRALSEDHGLEVPAACGRWYRAALTSDDGDWCKVCASKVGPPPGMRPAAAYENEYIPGDRIRHHRHGLGTVWRVDGTGPGTVLHVRMDSGLDLRLLATVSTIEHAGEGV